MLEFLQQNYNALLTKTIEHLGISIISLLLGTIVAVPIGILLSYRKNLSKIFIGMASMLQTIPSLALLAIMIPLFGVGKPPAVMALFVYSLLPILRNTLIGLQNVPFSIIDAGKGMGMTRRQMMLKVQIPMAAPIIFAGIRLSGVYVIAWTTIASYIGAGGLGDFIFTGLNNYIPPMIVLGTIPVTIIALLFDGFMGYYEENILKVKLGLKNRRGAKA